MHLRNLMPFWHFISQAPLWLAALFQAGLALAAMLIWSRITGDSRKRLPVLVFFLASGFIDCAALALLPLLGLSFGQPGLPVIGIGAVRFFLFAALLLAWKLASKVIRPLASNAGRLGLVIAFGITGAALTGCELYGLYVEPFSLSVTKSSINLGGLKAPSSVRIAQLSDLHIERITGRELAVLSALSDIRPDVIVLTGDYLNTSYLDDARAQNDARWFLSRLKAPLGVYAVVSYYTDMPKITDRIFYGTGVTFLNDKTARLDVKGDLYLIGVSDISFRRDLWALESLKAGVPRRASTVLLYHTPDLIEEASRLGIDLYFCGHTHGGQIRLPFYGALLTFSRYYKKYEMGAYKAGKTTLYVSRGIGMEGHGAPRARFLCKPEIVVMEVVPDRIDG